MRQDHKSNILDLFYSKCKECGLKITPQRVAVYEELCKSNKHPTAEQLHSEVRKRYPNVSLDTVNRTLLTFAEIGLIEIVESYGSPRRYDANLQMHHHIHCVKCGAILDFQSKEFDNLKIPEVIRRKFRIIGKKVILNGICSKCRG